MPRQKQLDPAILEAALAGLEAKRARLDQQIADVRRLLGGGGGGVPVPQPIGPGPVGRRRSRMSAEARKRIAAAQRKRWAAVRAKGKSRRAAART